MVCRKKVFVEEVSGFVMASKTLQNKEVLKGIFYLHLQIIETNIYFKRKNIMEVLRLLTKI